MSEMPKNWPPEFAKRAAENLDLVRRDGDHDVTQTVLTLYALVVVPDEADVFSLIKDRSRSELEEDGWPIRNWCWQYIVQRRGAPRIASDGMKALLRMLRNALAHGHLEFKSAGGKVVGLQFSHRRERNTICGYCSTTDALIVCKKVLELIERLDQAEPENEP